MNRFTAGLIFLAPSLRTRAGFTVAAQRLGGDVVDVSETRYDPSMSRAESVEDTLRAMDLLSDILVVRGPIELEQSVKRLGLTCPVINAGDYTAHPSQALIDLYTIQQILGNVEGLRVGLCGDLTMRAARSLIALLGLYPPVELTLIAPPERQIEPAKIPGSPRSRLSIRHEADFSELDVLYLPGFPAGTGETRLSADRRRGFSLRPSSIASLPAEAVVLSPLPIIDEIEASVMGDPRVRLWATHANSTPVRMAVLEHVLGNAQAATRISQLTES